MIRFLQISDTHWSFDPITLPCGQLQIDTAKRFELLCRWIESLADPVDFIVHTGDWVHRGHVAGDSGESTRKVWDLAQRLGFPVLTAVGNHDHRSVLRECFEKSIAKLAANSSVRPSGEMLASVAGLADGKPLGLVGGRDAPDECERLCYRFTCKGEDFLVIDARDSQSIDPRGRIDSEQLIAIERYFANTTKACTLFLHYPPIRLDCHWIDRTMCVENGEELHSLLRKYRDRVRGVFFGHIHRPISAVVDGVMYASCGSSAMHFPNFPSQGDVEFESDPLAFANYVTIDGNSVLVKPQWVGTSQ
jgi:3',5'-cyclic AMP phosphodiesterase CpdA